MVDYSHLSHIVVTPCRDESDFLPSIIDSMSRQTVIPTKWVIVSHNSGDKTNHILEEACANLGWIKVMEVNDDSPRRRGAQIAKLVNKGLDSTDFEWDYFSKIDSDMILPSDYFEKIFDEFHNSEDLGIASGSCYIVNRGRKIDEVVAPKHTRGGLKTYRRGCFLEIGGIREIDGWDGIDNSLAQMAGWQTSSFPNISVEHQRATGSYSGLVRGCFESGKFAFSMRYLPIFILARSIVRMGKKPLIVGGISMFCGYLYGFVSRHEKFDDLEAARFLRNGQKERLKFWK